MDFVVVIPARYASTRLPGKALLDIAGKPMVVQVAERAKASGAVEVWVATDDERVRNAVSEHGHRCLMTAASHNSGTDRIAEVARAHAWAATEIIVNVQGDEPLMPRGLIQQVAALLAAYPQADIGTLATPIDSLAQLMDPNAVKVVSDVQGRALYFSRAPIPWNRDGAPSALASQRDFSGARRHIGLYAYRIGALLRLAQLPPAQLEAREQLEQLRALEHGFNIQVAEACERPGPDVNTLADLERVAALLAQDPGLKR